MPWSDKNSCSSSIVCKHADKPLFVDERKQMPAFLAVVLHARDITRQVRSVFEKPFGPAAKIRAAFRAILPRCVSTAKSGIRPTIERSFDRKLLAVSNAERRNKTRRVRSKARFLHCRRCSSRRQYKQNARRTCLPRLRKPCPRWASSSAIASIFRQYIAIQLVPSDCSRAPPPARGLLRSKTPILSRPRNPPSKTLLPSASFAIHPPREIQQQLVKNPLQKCAVAVAASVFFDLVNAKRRPRVNRRIDIAECPFVSGNLPVRVHIPFAKQQN